MPTSVTAALNDGEVSVTGASGTSAASANIRGSTTVTTGTTAPGSGTTDTIVVAIGYKCNDNALGSASSRATAALFNVEGASSTVLQCQET